MKSVFPANVITVGVMLLASCSTQEERVDKPTTTPAAPATKSAEAKTEAGAKAEGKAEAKVKVGALAFGLVALTGRENFARVNFLLVDKVFTPKVYDL